ncbi:MAG: RNA polymerase sigma factor [Thermomicrobiales bacterium]
MSSADASSTDSQLVVAARAGSETAWTVLVERYYPLLVRYLTGRTGDPDLAADLTQDSFLVTLIDLDQPGAERDFGAWLYRIAQNRLRAARRKQRRRQVVSMEWLREQPGQAEQVLSGSRQPDEFAVVGERELVERVLADLSPALREALLLHSLKGLTAPEVAGVLGISIAAAERRISRAQQQFRLRYDAYVRDAEQEG